LIEFCEFITVGETMQHKVSQILGALILLLPLAALSQTAAPQARPTPPETLAPAEPMSPATLPGNGLAQHPFLYCGEWNYIKPQQTMYIIQDSKVAWSYDIPLNVVINGKPNKEEYSDCTRLSNGNVLFSRRFGATEVTPDKKVVWNYDAPGQSEVHSVQAIGNDRVLIAQNGNPAKLLLIDKATNKIEKEIILTVKKPDSFHGQMRRARMTKAGTFLVGHMDLNKVIEYDASGKEIWSVVAEGPWSAVRLKNGNTLIGGDSHGYAREVNPKGETVWELTRADLPGYKIGNIQQVERLSNGNTVISNWIAGPTKPEDWPNTVQFIEVTPDKKVVWALRQWENPNLGPATSIQLLDEPGVPENGDLQR
jgi:hypothetical protein